MWLEHLGRSSGAHLREQLGPERSPVGGVGEPEPLLGQLAERRVDDLDLVGVAGADELRDVDAFGGEWRTDDLDQDDVRQQLRGFPVTQVDRPEVPRVRPRELHRELEILSRDLHAVRGGKDVAITTAARGGQHGQECNECDQTAVPHGGQ